MAGQEKGAVETISDPDAQNAEQDDESAQAQQVAEEALSEPWRARAGSGSRHGGRTNPAQLIPDDVPDLVDRMEEMDRTGHIDMGAFEGEEDMADEAEDEDEF